MHLPQIRRALAPTDYELVSKKISPKALRQMRRERRQVVAGPSAVGSDDVDAIVHQQRRHGLRSRAGGVLAQPYGGLPAVQACRRRDV